MLFLSLWEKNAAACKLQARSFSDPWIIGLREHQFPLILKLGQFLSSTDDANSAPARQILGWFVFLTDDGSTSWKCAQIIEQSVRPLRSLAYRRSKFPAPSSRGTRVISRLSHSSALVGLAWHRKFTSCLFSAYKVQRKLVAQTLLRVNKTHDVWTYPQGGKGYSSSAAYYTAALWLQLWLMAELGGSQVCVERQLHFRVVIIASDTGASRIKLNFAFIISLLQRKIKVCQLWESSSELSQEPCRLGLLLILQGNDRDLDDFGNMWAWGAAASWFLFWPVREVALFIFLGYLGVRVQHCAAALRAISDPQLIFNYRLLNLSYKVTCCVRS